MKGVFSLTELISTSQINFLFIFIEGLLSFFSPCVIPLIPVYMGYLAGNAKKTGDDGAIYYEQKKVFFHTVFFVLGISTAFFLLGMSFTALGSFFKEHQLYFTRVGGILIILFGLIQIGFLDFQFLQRERKINLNLGERKIGPFLAYLMGFTFSFAWTPCVGPALSSVLILASGSSQTVGNLLVLVYAAGFVIPFLLLGLFTTQALNFLKKHQKLLKYTVKAGGILLILIGIMTFTGWMNGVSSYFNRFTASGSQNGTSVPVEEPTATPSPTTAPAATDDSAPTTAPTQAPAVSPDSDTTASSSDTDTEGNSADSDQKKYPAIDFTLTDQYGNVHTLSDYQGKVVFLNFWATWCGPCKQEMPDIEELYNEYGKNEGDVIILGVANPSSEEYPNNSDVSKDEVIAFLEDNAYTFPVVFDETGDILESYYISAFPTTFLIDKDGNIFGYATGTLTKDIMLNAVEQAIASTK